MRALTIGILVMILASSSLTAQTLRVRGERDLRFGTLFPGIPETVLWSDGTRRGQYRIRSNTFFAPVMVQLVLPPDMIGPGGATMPLTFGPADAAYWLPFFGATPFDPQAPVSFILFPRAARIYLGGTATPSVSQAAGNYTAIITLIVAFTGA